MGYIVVKTFLSPGIRDRNLKNTHKNEISDYTCGICRHRAGISRKNVLLMLRHLPPAY